jgi:hypothetical protein
MLSWPLSAKGPRDSAKTATTYEHKPLKTVADSYATETNIISRVMLLQTTAIKIE